MRELSTCSGPWQGFWIQGSTRGWMNIDMKIRAGRLIAEGSDQSGSFRMFGEHDPSTDQVQIDKNYPWLFIEYSGRWDGTMIAGEWRFSMPDDVDTELYASDEQPDHGVFEIWPLESEADSLRLSELMQAPEPLIAHAGR